MDSITGNLTLKVLSARRESTGSSPLHRVNEEERQ